MKYNSVVIIIITTGIVLLSSTVPLGLIATGWPNLLFLLPSAVGETAIDPACKRHRVGSVTGVKVAMKHLMGVSRVT
jgi:hypothetical protein